MRIHPPFKKTIVAIQNPEEFFMHMESIVGSDTNSRKRFVGKISESGFVIEKSQNLMNTFRPRLRGSYIKNNGEPIKLQIHIESQNKPIVFIAAFLCLVVITGITKSSNYTLHILISCSIFLYLLHWIMFSIDLKKTKQELENIKKKASS
jgi:hypothetical protein